jgi:penicillin-binding protein 1A
MAGRAGTGAVPKRGRIKPMARQSNRSWKRTFRLLVFGIVFSFILTASIAGVLLWQGIATDLPPVDRLLHYRPPAATRVLAEDGTQIGEFYFERRYLVPLERVPAFVRAAFIAAEDANFYRHGGIDFLGIVRALFRNLQRGTVVQGGSTITQQVVKSLLLSPEKSYRRKLREIILALRLERQLTKDEILYLYLNQIYFGSGAYGVAAAAQAYFGKEVDDLTLAEGALLAGLPQAPSRYSPVRHPDRAKARQRYVLAQMEEEHYITPAQRLAALQEDIVLAGRGPLSYTAAPDYVEHVRRILEDRYGGTAPYQMGLNVQTAVDLRMQKAAEAAIREGLEDLDRQRHYAGALYHLEPSAVEPFLKRQGNVPAAVGAAYSAVVIAARGDSVAVRVGSERGVLDPNTPGWKKRRGNEPLRPGDVLPVRVLSRDDPDGLRLTLDERPPVEGALVAIDPATGEVKAMVGGYDFRRSQFNRAVQSERQPGSAFKPLLYAAAVDRGYTAATLVFDGPISVANGNLPAWSPRNYNDRYFGWTTLRNALARSLNTVTVRVTESVGLSPLMESLKRFRVFRRMPPRNLSIALGSAEVSLLKLTQAYATFATLGERPSAMFIRRISDDRGNVIEEAEPRFERVLSPATAYIVTSMMQTVVERGTGRRAQALGRPCAGKTGTTNESRDAWFLGFTPDLVVGVWVGFDSERSLGKGATGGRVALPIWISFMERALEGRPITDFRIPPDVVFVNIDEATGLRAVPGRASVLEVFRRGTEPLRHPAISAPPPEEPEWDHLDDGEVLPPDAIKDINYLD